MEPPAEIKFDKCPRCNRDWNIEETRWLPRPGRAFADVYYRLVCDNCNTKHTTYETDECNLVLFSPLVNNYHLGWDFHRHRCLYVSLDERTYLPWLPFDISLEKLKLYLLFS